MGGRLAATPVREVAKAEVNNVMVALETGQVTGRIVLTEPASGG